jgi:hypothetical protein
MTGLYFLFSIIGVAIIIAWYIENDNTPPGVPTKGLLRMQDSGTSPNAARQEVAPKRETVDAIDPDSGSRPANLG